MPFSSFNATGEKPAAAVPAPRPASEPVTPVQVAEVPQESWWTHSDLGDDYQPESTAEPAVRPKGLPDNSYWNAEDGCYRVKWGKYRNWYLTPGFDPTQPDLHDGNWQPRQRVTTFIDKAKGGGDSFGLDRYKIIHALVGVLLNPALMGEAMPLALEYQDKQFLDEDTYKAQNRLWNPIIEAAHELSGGNRGQKNGKVLHYCTEQVDKGVWTLEDVPLRWRRHVQAYIELRDGRGEGPGFTVDPKWIERVCNPDPDYDVDGTFDRLVLFQAPDELIDSINRARQFAINPKDPTGEPGLPPLPYETEPRWTVLDVKSGDVDYDRDKFGRQCTVYSRAEGVGNYDNGFHYELLPDPMNRDYCLVVSLPWWDSDPTAELLAVPYINAAGDYGITLCGAVRDLPPAPKLPAVARAKAPVETVVEGEMVSTPAELPAVKVRKCGACGQPGHTRAKCTAMAAPVAPEPEPAEEETRAAALLGTPTTVQAAEPEPVSTPSLPARNQEALSWEERITQCTTVDELKAVRAQARECHVSDETWKARYFPLAKETRDKILAEEKSA